MRKAPKLALVLHCLLLYAGITSLAATVSPSPPTPKKGVQIIKRMYSTWKGKWYPNFAFEQKAIFYEGDKITKEETWQEVYAQPGNLHIRFNGFDSGNGVVFAADSVYQFKDHKLHSRQYQIHPLVLLSFDVYFTKPESTLEKLQSLGFDLSKTTEANWKGRAAYVVGTTDASDSQSPQFWVDKERLYVLRVLTNNKGNTRDVEINNYQQIEDKWVATEIVFKTNGQTTLREEYFNISFPTQVNKDWFDLEKFSTTKW
ncbi:hypothetical protein CLV24_10890 [Pontibacter ummariensis]|uniref:Outer membrane lipoprotein-sorting protein n=1 Tax=Pontibacter ummariensis TaxID=1610492 RepID=A0A239FCM4_9BACT|nr:outer membrane lipoprotein-sorting protein [Pontibacter ummariensis]PRY12346.1 hypothetical protein CLV24_10890 [Pontibacter ummariensis]SNS53902.1 hypothetical protein SAMN06296052_10895 [Pontibacter ummariensis]